MRSAALRKSITDLTRRRARTLFTVATLALAVASVGIFALPPLTDRAMQDEIAADRLPDLTLETRALVLGRGDLAALARLPDVQAVEGRSYFETRAFVGARRAKVLLIGVPDFARQQVDVVHVASGAPPADGRALTDAQNARTDRYDGAAGDVLRVIAADGSVSPIRITGEGRNLAGGQEVTGEEVAVLYTTSRTLATLSGERGYEALSFRLDGGADVHATVEAVRRELEARTAFAGFTALPHVREPGDWPGKQDLEDFAQIFDSVAILALLSALVLVASTMTALVGEQTGEIATMKAIGGRRRQIVAIYVRTALMLGALGTLVGVLLGLALANALVRFFGNEFFAIEPGLGADPPVLAASVVLGLLGPVLAALPAIRRGTRITVREALQATVASIGGGGRLDGALRHVGFLPRTAQIGLRGVALRRRRSLAAVVQIALAVGSMLAVLGLSAAVAQTVHGNWADHNWNLWLGAPGRPFDARAIRLARDTPGVAQAEPLVTGAVRLNGEDAVTWGTATRTLFGHHVSQGRWHTPAEQRARARVAVVERDLARSAGIEVGDSASVATPAGDTDFRVVGIADNKQEEGTVLFIPLSTAQELAGLGDRSTGLWVRTGSDDEALIDRTATRLEDTSSRTASR
jgi:putative ABC transport system permease protein